MIADGPIKVVKGYSRCSANSMKCNIYQNFELINASIFLVKLFSPVCNHIWKLLLKIKYSCQS